LVSVSDTEAGSSASERAAGAPIPSDLADGGLDVLLATWQGDFWAIVP
jgi:hypothetical protein